MSEQRLCGEEGPGVMKVADAGCGATKADGTGHGNAGRDPTGGRSRAAASGRRGAPRQASALLIGGQESTAASHGRSFIIGARIPGSPTSSKAWHEAHPDEEIPDGRVFTQPVARLPV